MNKVIVGRVIRLKRQEKGLNIGDLAGEDISTGTISRIENGAEVTDRKFYCLIEKLGLSTRELVRQVRELEEDDERLLYQLLGIESTLDHYGAEGLKEAKFCLKSITKKMDNNHPYSPLLTYLKGKKSRYEGDYDKAINHLSAALDEIGQNNYYCDRNNIKASIFNELALNHYLKNDIQNAIKQAKQGIETFVMNGERQYILYTLQANLALFHEKTGSITKAKEILKKLWEKHKEIDKAPVNILMCAILARILKKEKRYREMKKYIRRGIEIARTNHLDKEEFSLWVELGDYYTDTGEYAAAEHCLVTAYNLTKMAARIGKRQFSTLLLLGKLYVKLKKYAEAESILSQAEKVAKKYKDELKEIDALIAYSELYQSQHKYTEAIIKLNNSLLLLRDKTLIHKRIEIIERLIYCTKQLGGDLRGVEKLFDELNNLKGGLINGG